MGIGIAISVDVRSGFIATEVEPPPPPPEE